MTLREIGAEFRRMREERGLSKYQLAERSGMIRAQILNIEAGRRNAQLETLMKLAGAMDCTLEVHLKPKKSTESNSG